MAEQLAFDQLFRNRRAVHFDERLRRARAGRVNRVRDQFLAGAAFAEDQHAAVGGGHQRQLLAQRLHRHAFADDAQLGVSVPRNRCSSSSSRRCCTALLITTVTFSMVSGFSKKIERAQLGGLHGGFDGAVAGDDDHFGAIGEGNFLNARQRLQAIHAGSQTSSSTTS